MKFAGHKISFEYGWKKFILENTIADDWKQEILNPGVKENLIFCE